MGKPSRWSRWVIEASADPRNSVPWSLSVRRQRALVRSKAMPA